MSEAVFSIHSPWVKSTLKFVVAISIPVGLVWAFMSAQQNADRAVKETQDAIKNNPNVEGMVVKDYELKEIDDSNAVRWALTASEGKMAPNNKDVSLQKVNVKYYDGPNVKMSITAPSGNANADTKYVKMVSDKTQRVVAEGDAGKSRFEAQTVELTKKNQFLATGGVIIEWSEVAKVTGNSATGIVDKSGVKDVTVRGLPGQPTHAVIVCK